MIKDERYQDNVILKKEALQELLTNIKNYPIIDIDYIEEKELDLETPNPESTIWDRFTNGAPCLKITYGDVDTDKGKVALADAETKENISRWQKDIINKSKILAEKEIEKSRWQDILDENKALKKNKQDEISAYINGQAKLVSNIITELKESYDNVSILDGINREKSYFIGAALPILTSNKSNINWAFVQITLERTNDEENPISVTSITYPYGKEQDENSEEPSIEEVGLTFKENFPDLDLSKIDFQQEPIINLYVLTDWEKAVGAIIDSLSQLETNKNDQILRFPEEKTQIEEDYNRTKTQLDNLYKAYIDGRSWLSAGIAQDDTTVVTAGSDYEGMLHALNAYIENYITEEIDPKIERANTKINAVEQDINNLTGDLKNTKVIKDQNDSIILQDENNQQVNEDNWGIKQYKQMIKALQDNIVVTDDQLPGLLGHKYVKVGSSINFKDNKTGYKTLVYLQNGDDNIPDGQTEGYYLYDSEQDTYIPLVYLPEENGQTEGYYLYDSEQDTYIPWDQEFGTFRVTVNGKIYEVNINGLSKDNNGNHHIDGPLILDSPLFVYKNIGTDENDNPIIQKIQLAGNDANGGFPNDDGYGDKRYFWRSDGEWANELENNLKLTTHSSLAVNNLPVNGTRLTLGKGIYNNNDASLADILIQNTYGLSNIPEVAYSGGGIEWRYQATDLPVEDINANINKIYYQGKRKIKLITYDYPGDGNVDYSGDGENQHYWLETPFIGQPDDIRTYTPYFGAGASEFQSNYTSADHQDWDVYTRVRQLLYELAEEGVEKDVYLHLLTTQEIEYNTYNKYYLQTTELQSGEQATDYFVRVSYTPIYCSNTIKSSTVNQLNIYKSNTNNQPATSIDVDNGWLIANKVFNAVFNDYAEYRKTINLTPGHIVVDNDDGTLSCTTERLMPGAQVISDTFGSSMGLSNECQTPLAVAGRALVYTYQTRENYHAGMAVCSAPGGTVDIMTREEIKEYPDCIVGIVSEIPQYETWGSDNVKVDGRIWIKVK